MLLSRQKYHFAKDCRSQPHGQRGGHLRFNNNTPHARVIETGDKSRSEHPETDDATIVAHIYHDPQYHFVAPESQTAEAAADF